MGSLPSVIEHSISTSTFFDDKSEEYLLAALPTQAAIGKWHVKGVCVLKLIDTSSMFRTAEGFFETAGLNAEKTNIQSAEP